MTPEPDRKPVLITGGAGFIGTNLATRLLEAGESVLVLDNLSRAGVESNLKDLEARFPERLHAELADVRDPEVVRAAVARSSAVFHLAAQVAVTSSVECPERDFECNVRGTFNVLEALRALEAPPPLLFTSTNKVYGALENVRLRKSRGRYRPVAEVFARGLDESQPLHFQTPYGCSKGAADQYVLDYAQQYGLRAVVFRMSCVYGPHQFGTEDQGWVAHFLIRALNGEPIVVYGDGCQVRDLLYVGDLVDAMQHAMRDVERLSGQAFNIGGGPRNSKSLRDVLDDIAELVGSRPRVVFSDWRTHDQRYFVANSDKFERETGWRPSTSVRQGLANLREWLRTHGPKAAAPDEPRTPGVRGEPGTTHYATLR